MKLILASAGFATEEIIRTCERLVGKSRNTINIAVINEAYAVEHDDNLRWVLDDLNRVRDNFGGKLELVNLLALDKKTIHERLQAADIIFVVGGNADYLMHVLATTGVAEMLPELLKTTVYVGSSAGGMVLGRRLSTEGYKTIYGEESLYPVHEYLKYVPMSILPHLDSPHFSNRRSKIQTLSKTYQGTIYGLRDDSAIVVEDSHYTTIGSEPYIIQS